MEVVVTGNVYDCGAGTTPASTPVCIIFNADRSRFNAPAASTGAPRRSTPARPQRRLQRHRERRSPTRSPPTWMATAVWKSSIASYDGRLHAFWLDKTEHGNWPLCGLPARRGLLPLRLRAGRRRSGRRWARRSDLHLLDAERHRATGKLHILDYLGNLLHVVDLPPALQATGTAPCPPPPWRTSTATPTWKWCSTPPIPAWWRMICPAPPALKFCGGRDGEVIGETGICLNPPDHHSWYLGGDSRSA